MIVRITANLSDPSAQDLYRKFHEDGFAPWGNDEMLMGFVKDAVLTPDNYIITVDVTNPQAIEYIYSLQTSGPDRDRTPGRTTPRSPG